MTKPIWRGVPGRLLAIFGLLVFLSGAMMAVGPGDDDASSSQISPVPTVYPSFVMELAITRGDLVTTATFDYVSADEWLYQEFDANGSLLRSQQLQAGQVTMMNAGFGQRVYPAGDDVTVPTTWFIDADSMRGRGASRLGSSASFELVSSIPCGQEDPRCTEGMSTVGVATRADYDPSSGVLIGYTETVNGKVVMTVTATRLTVD